MKLYYKNSIGKVVEFSKWPVMYQEPEGLLEKEWKYDANNDASYGGKVKRFYRGIEEKPLKVSVFANNMDMFYRVMDSMDECFETDIAKKEPGKLYFNDSYLKCYIKKSGYSEWEEDFYSFDQELTILAEYPFWITESAYNFKASEVTTTNNKRYPYRYSYRYANGLNNVSVINEHFAPVHFLMVIYGPCVNPHIIIGGHRYQVDILVEPGEFLTVDSRARTVKKTMNNGTIVNSFHNRSFQISVFEKIPSGRNEVSWPGTFDFDLTLLAERSEPKWT